MNESGAKEVVLSILIVNFNGKRFLADCLESIKKYVAVSYEVIIVDNASGDGSSEYIEQNFPEVVLLKSEVNLGFTGGNNLGSSKARGMYLLLLNNDTVITSSLNPLVELMRQNRNIGALGCTLTYGDGRLQESVGYEHTALRVIFSWLPISALLPDNVGRRTVTSKSKEYLKDFALADWVSGAFLISPLSLWKQLGGLDERYFMYIEDVDYCRRVHDAGFEVVYSNLARVIHFEGGGRSWIGRRAVLNTTNSYVVYASKFYGPISRLCIRTLLPSIFLVRATSHWLMHLLGRDADGGEKASAFQAAAWRLLGGHAL